MCLDLYYGAPFDRTTLPHHGTCSFNFDLMFIIDQEFRRPTNVLGKLAAKYLLSLTGWCQAIIWIVTKRQNSTVETIGYITHENASSAIQQFKIFSGVILLKPELPYWIWPPGVRRRGRLFGLSWKITPPPPHQQFLDPPLCAVLSTSAPM